MSLCAEGAVRRHGIDWIEAQDAVRLDADVIEWFEAQGADDQVRINAALRSYVAAHKEREAAASRR